MQGAFRYGIDAVRDAVSAFVGYAPRLEDAILPQVDDFRRAYEAFAARRRPEFEGD